MGRINDVGGTAGFPAIAQELDEPVTVWGASAESRYLVLPVRPAGTGQLDEAALAGLVTRNGLNGVAPF